MKFLSLAVIVSPVLGGIITIHRTTTPPPRIITTTIQPGAETVQATTTDAITLFEAVTSPVTIATGTVITTIGSSKSAPVTQQSSYSTTSLATTVNPSTYTTAIIPVSTDAPVESVSYSTVASSSVASSTGTVVSPSSPSSSSSSAAAASSSSSSSKLTSAAPTTTSVSTSTSVSSTSSSSAPVNPAANYYSDGSIFDAIDTAEPLSMFSQEPIPLDIPENVHINGPFQTNKYFANVFLNTQQLSIFPQPYALWQSNDTNYYGLGISYTNASQQVFGPDPNSDPAEYYINPLMLGAFYLSAQELTNDNLGFSVQNNSALSVTLELQASAGTLTVPTAIGMGFVTGIYNGLTPRLFSQLGVSQLVQQKALSNGIQKYTATLFGGWQWNIYVTVPNNQDFQLKANSDYEIVGSSAIDGLVIQLAIVTGDDSPIDQAAGAYPVSNSIDASVSNDIATYSIDYEVEGQSIGGTTLLYALPHHVASFTSELENAKTDLVVYSRTKGYLTGVLANKLEMTETLYTDLQWLPWQIDNANNSISAEALQLLATTVNSELAEDMVGQTDTTSTYTAGKGFDKFAYILLVASEILENEAVTKQGLASLKSALSPWLNNTQPTPFIYDTNFKGVTSSAANMPGGSSLDDYGAPFYNDHHFHYGYYVHAAAVIGYLDQKYGDGSWVTENKDWVNSLVRDVANPSVEDTHFPVFRMFDFFSGHSWAAGLFESGDGKNEESTSEDYNFAYGMKLWGKTIGDKSMEARGDLLLSIMKRSMPTYFLFEDGNDIQPSKILPNRVAGISFENKLDHTTFFGTNIEYIQGIQMIPLTGASGLIRPSTFVQQEWNSLLSSVVGGLDSGWAGILRANQALFDPQSSYQYFAQDGFQSAWLDGGASRSWYLAFAAGLGGSS